MQEIDAWAPAISLMAKRNRCIPGCSTDPFDGLNCAKHSRGFGHRHEIETVALTAVRERAVGYDVM